jgi:hypothetical protein
MVELTTKPSQRPTVPKRASPHAIFLYHGPIAVRYAQFGTIKRPQLKPVNPPQGGTKRMCRSD